MSEGNFNSKRGSEERWMPTKNADGTPRTTAPDANDVRFGWYVSSKEMTHNNKTFSVHTFEQKDGTRFDVAGTKMLNDMVLETHPGEFCRIQWLGKQAAKKVGGDPYHVWDLGTDDTQRKTPQFGSPAKTPAAAAPNVAPMTVPTQANPSTANAMPPMADDDQLPF